MKVTGIEEELRPAICSQATITVAVDVGVRHRQELRFATSEWHKRYATLHNRLMAILDAVAEAPPPQFSGGGQWEAMHGDMGGYYEILHKAQSGSSFDFSAFLRMQA